MPKGHVKIDAPASARRLAGDSNDEVKQRASEPSGMNELSSSLGNPRARQSRKRNTNKRRNRGSTSQEASAGSQSSRTRTHKGDKKKARNSDGTNKVVAERRNKRKKQGVTKRTNRKKRMEGQKKPQQMNGAILNNHLDQQPQAIDDSVENTVLAFAGEPKADKTIVGVTLSGGGSSAAENFMTKFNQSWSTNHSGKPGNGQEYNRYKTKRMKTAGSAGWNPPGVYGSTTTSTSWGSSGGASKAWKGTGDSWGNSWGNGDVLLEEMNCPCTYVDPPSWGGGGWSGSAWGGSAWSTSAWGTSTWDSSSKAGKSTPIPHSQRIKVCTCMPTYFPTYIPTYMPTT
jgi:hypothetical protein